MILLTGATGYIASHTWLALGEAGHEVVGIDDFSNSSPEVLRRLEALGADVSRFVRADVKDRAALDAVFARWPIEAAIHFAALKAVGESVERPLDYYATNVGGLVALAGAMQARRCRTIVFSSSATVYGQPERLPIREDAPLSATSPYGATKLICEGILRDLERADPAWRVAVLRYFNPVGAHESGLIGEDPRGTPNNLMPYVTQVAVGKRPALQVFGSDYDTPDGTGVRDYLHVQDLALAHVAAAQALAEGRPLARVYNLGSGDGVSVRQIIDAMARVTGVDFEPEVGPRRPGDPARIVASGAAAAADLGWTMRHSLDEMVASAWQAWQTVGSTR